eukprot:3763507-Rhodomonas_salina.4
MSDGKQGMDLLRDPAVNRGDAYTMAERKALGLQGLVPPASKTINVQAVLCDDPLSNWGALHLRKRRQTENSRCVLLRLGASSSSSLR